MCLRGNPSADVRKLQLTGLSFFMVYNMSHEHKLVFVLQAELKGCFLHVHSECTVFVCGCFVSVIIKSTLVTALL